MYTEFRKRLQLWEWNEAYVCSGRHARIVSPLLNVTHATDNPAGALDHLGTGHLCPADCEGLWTLDDDLISGADVFACVDHTGREGRTVMARI